MLKPEEDDHKMADTDYFSSFRWISRKNSVVGSVATLNKGSSPSLSWAWPSSAQLVCVPSLCNPDSCFWTWLPTLWLSECWHLLARDWQWPWCNGCHLHWPWLHTLCWCGLSVVWLPQCAAKYIQTIKGTELLCLAVSWRGSTGWLPMVVTTMMVLLWIPDDWDIRRTSWTDRIWQGSYLWLNPQILKHDRQGEGRRY